MSHLPQVIGYYRAHGFTVTPGGKHQGGLTHNALIGFADGSYLELLAPLQPGLPARLRVLRRLGLWRLAQIRRSPLQRRFLSHLADGEGLADLALATDDLQAAIGRAVGRGLALDGPLPGARLRPDGQRVLWQVAVPREPDLPFLIADQTPRALRVPSGDAARHENGVTGIARVTVRTLDLDQTARRYRALIGDEPLGEARGAGEFVFGGTTLTLEAAAAGSPRLALTLRTAG